jgi:hypothetical protein
MIALRRAVSNDWLRDITAHPAEIRVRRYAGECDVVVFFRGRRTRSKSRQGAAAAWCIRNNKPVGRSVRF